MAKGISRNGKIHKNRDKEFFNSIAGKYQLSENSLSFLPKLTYLETAHMISYIAGNSYFVNKNLDLKNYSIKRQQQNRYFNNTTKRVSVNNYNANNYSTQNYNVYNYVKNNFRSYNDQENDSGYKAQPNISRRSQGPERNVNGMAVYGANRLTGSYTRLAEKGTTKVLTSGEAIYFIGLNNILRQVFSENKDSSGIAGPRPVLSPKGVRTISPNLPVVNARGLILQRPNTMTDWARIDTADHDSLDRETKAKTRNINKNFKKETLLIDDTHFYSGSENKPNNYSTVHRKNGVKAGSQNIYSQSPGLELARNEAARSENKKSEAPSRNIVSEGAKEVNKQTPLDINKIVSQVYNELERKFRIERERRGL